MGVDYATMFRLDGKAAIVTGGGGGIGSAMAEGLATAGARVALGVLGLPQAERVAAGLAAKGLRTVAVAVDVTSRASAERMVEQTLAAFGRVDILCNNAGITLNQPTVEMDEAIWDKVLAVNLKGVFLCAQAVARQMIAAGNGGKIINTGSISGLVAEDPTEPPYGASKAGVLQLPRHWANEWAQHRINVNAIAPSY